MDVDFRLLCSSSGKAAFFSRRCLATCLSARGDPMTLKLYAHPFSSYCQKVLIALYENRTPFEFRMLGPDDAQAASEHEALWPLRRMPLLVDGGSTVVESSIIIEHLDLHHPGPVRLIPGDAR